MKTAVSIPDEVFRKAEAAAKRLKMSRSELYARAIDAFVDASSADAVTDAMDAALAELAPEEIAADVKVVRAGARQTMKRP
jgi:metal-responsive CopG/Arc/MetJ family transcriptional regulator